MYAVNFEYDGQYLSDYGFIICNFDYSNGINVAGHGSKITFNKVSRNQGKNNSLVGTLYEECLYAEIDICKDPERSNYGDREITSAEYRDLVRWLSRREFLKFQLIDCDDYTRDICYYNASFNVSKIFISDKLYGLRLSIETDKPFGHGNEIRHELEFAVGDLTETIVDRSDEIGYIYPNLEIHCLSDGDLSLSNDNSGCYMEIKNCSVGEIITVNGDALTLNSNLNSHNLAKDFNYDFFKISNTYSNRINTITSSLPCRVILTYAPIIKEPI